MGFDLGLGGGVLSLDLRLRARLFELGGGVGRRLARVVAGPAGAGRSRPLDDTPLSPRLAACCEIVMGLTMGYMLILML